MRSLILTAAAALALVPAMAQANNMYPQNYSSTYSYPATNSAQVLQLPSGYREAPVAATSTTTMQRTGYGSYPQQYPQYQPAVRPDTSRSTTITTTTVTANTPTARLMPVAVTIVPTEGVMLVDTDHYLAVTDNDAATNVQLRKACRGESNHRSRNKGIDTSTTVYGDCLN